MVIGEEVYGWKAVGSASGLFEVIVNQPALAIWQKIWTRTLRE